MAKCRRMDKKPSIALMGHESGPNPAIDAVKPIPKPASAAKLCSDDQTHHPAIAHLSPFWPRAQQIARKSHALRPAMRTRLCPPCPLSGDKHPRRRDASRATSYSKYLAAPTGMHWRMRPTSSASSKSIPWSNQWRVQPAQPFEKKSRQTPFPPHRARRARARGRRRRHAAHGALCDTGCSRPGR